MIPPVTYWFFFSWTVSSASERAHEEDLSHQDSRAPNTLSWGASSKPLASFIVILCYRYWGANTM
jgi:hypothetical protein